MMPYVSILLEVKKIGEVWESFLEIIFEVLTLTFEVIFDIILNLLFLLKFLFSN